MNTLSQKSNGLSHRVYQIKKTKTDKYISFLAFSTYFRGFYGYKWIAPMSVKLFTCLGLEKGGARSQGKTMRQLRQQRQDLTAVAVVVWRV